MAGVKLFQSANRSVAHAKLEEVLAGGTIDIDKDGVRTVSPTDELSMLDGDGNVIPRHKQACCRENTNDPEPYSVWSDSPDAYVSAPPPPSPINEEALLDRLADKLLERLEKRGK